MSLCVNGDVLVPAAAAAAVAGISSSGLSDLSILHSVLWGVSVTGRTQLIPRSYRNSFGLRFWVRFLVRLLVRLLVRSGINLDVRLGISLGFRFMLQPG